MTSAAVSLRGYRRQALSTGQILIIGKLALTFVVLLGLPLLDLWLLGREQRCANDEDEH